MLKTIVRLCLVLLLAPLALPAQPAQPKPAQQAQPAPQPAAQSPAGGPSPQSGGDLQILLNRVGFSPGVIDGKPGSNTWKALQAFQAAHDLPATGKPDAATWENLTAAGGNQMVVDYTITPEDVDGPFVPKMPEDMLEKSKLEVLAYTSPLEMLAERFHTTPGFLQKLNPGAKLTAGETLRVPNARHVSTDPQKALDDVRVVVSRSQGTLTVERGDDILFFAPVTSGSEHDPLPIGDWQVTSVSRNPVFNYNPDLFWDAEPGHSKAKIAPGPNNPVGLVWIDLSKEHYGLHGTPEPASVGKTSSHGCVRLTNWDALTVAGFVQKGTPVHFRP